MKVFDKFSPNHFTPNPSLMASVQDHRNQMGVVPRFRLLRQVVKAKVKSKYPEGWRFK